jgi:hypothetical protein
MCPGAQQAARHSRSLSSPHRTEVRRTSTQPIPANSRPCCPPLFPRIIRTDPTSSDARVIIYACCAPCGARHCGGDLLVRHAGRSRVDAGRVTEPDSHYRPSHHGRRCGQLVAHMSEVYSINTADTRLTSELLDFSHALCPATPDHRRQIATG